MFPSETSNGLENWTQQSPHCRLLPGRCFLGYSKSKVPWGTKGLYKPLLCFNHTGLFLCKHSKPIPIPDSLLLPLAFALPVLCLALSSQRHANDSSPAFHSGLCTSIRPNDRGSRCLGCTTSNPHPSALCPWAELHSYLSHQTARVLSVSSSWNIGIIRRGTWVCCLLHVQCLNQEVLRKYLLNEWSKQWMSDALLAIKKAAESRICPSKAAGVYEGQEIPMKNWKWSLGPSTLKLGSQRGRVHGEEGRAVRAGGRPISGSPAKWALSLWQLGYPQGNISRNEHQDAGGLVTWRWMAKAAFLLSVFCL